MSWVRFAWPWTVKKLARHASFNTTPKNYLQNNSRHTILYRQRNICLNRRIITQSSRHIGFAIDWIKFHANQNVRRGFTKPYQRYRYPGQRFSKGYQWNVYSNPEKRKNDNMLNNVLTITLLAILTSFALESQNLHDKNRHTILSSIRALIFGIVYRDDIQELRYKHDSMLSPSSSPLTTKSPFVTPTSFLSTKFSKLSKTFVTRTPLDPVSFDPLDQFGIANLRKRYVNSTANGIVLEIPIIPGITNLFDDECLRTYFITTTNQPGHLASSSPSQTSQLHDLSTQENSLPKGEQPQEEDKKEQPLLNSELYDHLIFSILHNSHSITTQNTAFSATVLYDSYQLLKDLNQNIGRLEFLSTHQKIDSFLVWHKLTRIRNFLGKELIKQHNSLQDLLHVKEGGEFQDESNNVNPSFGSQQQSILMSQILRSRVLAMKSQEFYRTIYHWGLFQLNYASPHFRALYCGNNTSSDDDLAQLHPTNNRQREGPITYPNGNPLPWSSVGEFKEAFERTITDLQQQQQSSYQALTKQAHQFYHWTDDTQDTASTIGKCSSEQGHNSQSTRTQRLDQPTCLQSTVMGDQKQQRVMSILKTTLPKLTSTIQSHFLLKPSQRFKIISDRDGLDDLNGTTTSKIPLGNEDDGHASLERRNGIFVYRYHPHIILSHTKMTLNPIRNDKTINVNLVRQWLYENYYQNYYRSHYYTSQQSENPLSQTQTGTECLDQFPLPPPPPPLDQRLSGSHAATTLLRLDYDVPTMDLRGKQLGLGTHNNYI